MKKNVILKMSLFSIICVVFVAYLLYYSNAFANEGTTHKHDFGKEFFFERITSFKEENFNKENNSAIKDSIVKSFSVNPKGTLSVDVSGADIDLKTWDKNEVNVVVQRKGSERALENYKISFESTKDNVTIKSENKNKRNFLNFGNNLSIEFTIFIPKEFYPDVKTSGGDISITDVFSNSNLRTSGGDVNVFNSTGNIEIKTSGGDIKISSNKGNIKASTSGGDMVFKGVTGNVDATTSGGDIVFKEIKGSVYASTSGGDIEVEIIGENKGVSLSTSGGDIELKISGDVKASLECKTSGGDVSLSNNSNFEGTIKSSSIIGKLNGGGPTIKAKTSGGDIDLKFNK